MAQFSKEIDRTKIKPVLKQSERRLNNEHDVQSNGTQVKAMLKKISKSCELYCQFDLGIIQISSKQDFGIFYPIHPPTHPALIKYERS